MRRKIQILIGLVLMIVVFGAVLLIAQRSQPQTYDVAVVMKDIPAYTPLTTDMLATDSQSVSAAVAQKYILTGDLPELLAAGAVSVENLHPGQPLLRVQVAAGVQAQGLSRLSVALKDPNLVIVAIPVVPSNLPAVFPGDAIALFFASGNVQAQTIQTTTVSGPTPTPTPRPLGVISQTTVLTTELQLPLAKWLSNGVVYRVNRQMKENPNYGAPGAAPDEPRYLDGDIQSLDVVVRRDAAEWVAFALANGKVQIGVLPAVNRPNVEKGDFGASAGVTWSDFEKRFFADRGQ